MSDLPVVEFKWSAREDLEGEIDAIALRDPELEHAWFLAGYVDDRGRVIVEAVRRNEIPPHSPDRVPFDGEAAARYERLGRGRVIGDWHSHPVLGPPEPSQAGYECWRRAAERLDQVYVGVVLARTRSGRAMPHPAQPGTAHVARRSAPGWHGRTPPSSAARSTSSRNGWPRRRAKSDSERDNMPRSATPDPNEILVCTTSHIVGVPGQAQGVAYQRGQRLRHELIPNAKPEFWLPDGDVLPTADQLRVRALAE